jgi:hypothetical protein
MSFQNPFFWDAIFGFRHPNYYKEISLRITLLHIVPFCEGPNEKPKGFV